MNHITRSRLLTVGGVAVVVLWVAFIGVYVSWVHPKFPGGLLLTATVVAGPLITTAFGAAVYYGVRALQYGEATNKSASILWLSLLTLVTLIIGWFTAMFTAFWWPEWYLAVFE